MRRLWGIGAVLVLAGCASPAPTPTPYDLTVSSGAVLRAEHYCETRSVNETCAVELGDDEVTELSAGGDLELRLDRAGEWDLTARVDGGGAVPVEAVDGNRWLLSVNYLTANLGEVIELRGARDDGVEGAWFTTTLRPVR